MPQAPPYSYDSLGPLLWRLLSHPILISSLSSLLHYCHYCYYIIIIIIIDRDRYGCCYGPYNLRNEIDRHNTTVGGHNSNTHFVTGDGGFINAFVSGFGGLMLGANQVRSLKLTVSFSQ